MDNGEDIEEKQFCENSREFVVKEKRTPILTQADNSPKKKLISNVKPGNKTRLLLYSSSLVSLDTSKVSF
jgi:hypothetical protein